MLEQASCPVRPGPCGPGSPEGAVGVEHLGLLGWGPMGFSLRVLSRAAKQSSQDRVPMGSVCRLSPVPQD